MSVSITPVQTLKTVAASVVSLSRMDTANAPGLRNAARSAKRMVEAISHNRNVDPMATAEVQAHAVYDAMRALNFSSFIAQYPSSYEDYKDNFAPLLDAKDFDFSRDAVPFKGAEGMDGMAFLRCSLDRVEHGLYGEVTNHNLSQNLAALGRDLGRAMAINSSVAIPTPSELAESITRLRAHGDYLYDMQSGASEVFKKLDTFGIGVNNEFYGDDTLLRTFLEATTNPDSMTVPVNSVPKGPSVAELRQGNYRVTGDIPYPTQSDMDTLNKAVEYTKAKLMTLPLVGTNGEALSEMESRRVRTQFANFASDQLWHGQQARFKPFTSLTHHSFPEASGIVNSNKLVRNNELFMVVDASYGLLPVYEESPTDRKDVSKNVRAIENAIDKTGGKAQLVRKDDLDLIVEQGLNVQALSIFLSNDEVRELGSQRVPVMSAGQYLLNTAVHNACDTLRNDEGKIPSLVRHVNDSPDALLGSDLAGIIVEELKKTVPGVEDGVVDSIREAVGKQYPTSSATWLRGEIERNMDTFARNALFSAGEIKPLSPDIGEVEDLTVALEMPDAGISPQERRRLQ